MSTVFDKWSELDTALLLRRIEAAHGSVVFDRYAYADPQHALKQIESVFGVTLNTAGVLSFSAIAAAIDAAVAGGGDTPDWVPANAKIYIDLVNVRAWTEADGIVAIDTLLGSDPNIQGAWSKDGAYSPENLTANGYVPSTETVIAFIGALRSAVLAGSTFAVGFKQFTTSSSNIFPSVVLASADGNYAIEIDLTLKFANTARGYSWAWSDRLNSGAVLNYAVGAINVLATTITNTRLEIAANGSNAVAGVLTGADYPPDTIVATFVDVGNDYTALQSITIYDALPNTTGLSALSETGVTNTAPHDITLPWNNLDDVQGGLGSNGTYAQTVKSAYPFPGPFVTLVTPSAADDEGNPLVFSLISDESGALSLQEENQLAVTADFASAGTYNFTLRATDPGGLYVEQEFTLTVTA